MAVKFPLEVKNGVKARNITELKENFDVEKVIGYFLDEKLKNWLDARYYEEEAEAVKRLDSSDPELAKKLCEIFGVEYEKESVIDTEEIFRRNERIAKLKQFTDDEEIISNIDSVAFNQEELADLYDKGLEKIYLCEGDFTIPKSKQKLSYVVINGAKCKGLIEMDFNDVLNHEEKSNFHEGMGYHCDEIPEKFANIIGLRPFISTEDYVVFFNQFDACCFDYLEKYGDSNCFILCNKQSEEVSTFHIPGYDREWTKLLGSSGNKIFLGSDDNIILYDIDSKKSLVIGTNVGSEFYFSVNNERVAYIDKKKRLILYDINSKVTMTIAENVEDPFVMFDNKLFYDGKIVKNGYWEEYLYLYDITNKQTIEIYNSKEMMVQQMIGYDDTVYILDYNVWDNTIRLLGFNIYNPQEDPSVFFKFRWNCSSDLKCCIQKTPYFVFIKAESGFPLYVFDMNTKELKQVASGCGHTITGSYYINGNFQVVGDYLYFMKGDDYGFKDVFRIELKKNTTEEIVGKSQYRAYYVDVRLEK